MVLPHFLAILLTILHTPSIITLNTKCKRKDVPGEDFLCVCDVTYCDFIKPIPDNKESNQFVKYISERGLSRMKQTIQSFVQKSCLDEPNMIVNPNKQYQTVMGFGGALTDAALINIDTLPESAQDYLLRTYFGPESIHYTIIRVPIAGTDFSIRPYTYDDDSPNDFQLHNFRLQEEDQNYKIPYLKRIQKLSSDHSLTLMACAWSAPTWMKYSNSFSGGPTSNLRFEYYQLWADYIIRFLNAYENFGITFRLLSGQNEPKVAELSEYYINGMRFTPEQQGTFFANNIGPTLRKNGYNYIELLTGDDQSIYMQEWITRLIRNNSAALQYIGGVALHWYTDAQEIPVDLATIQNIDQFQNKYMLYTEGCNGFTLFGQGVELGSWERGEKYLYNVLGDLNQNVVGWTDWNMMLTERGGPTYANNFVDSPIILANDNATFYKQPMFYALAHVSRFVVPSSVRINLENKFPSNRVRGSAFKTPNNQTILIILNKEDISFDAIIADVTRDDIIKTSIPRRSFITIVY